MDSRVGVPPGIKLQGFSPDCGFRPNTMKARSVNDMDVGVCE